MRMMLLLFALSGAVATPAAAQSTQPLSIRGHVQWLHLYGARGGQPVIVSSGDGGWMHLGPHVAETLAARGCFVVGFDVKAYLESFTSARGTLRPEDEPGDYKVLADFAATGGRRGRFWLACPRGRASPCWRRRTLPRGRRLPASSDSGCRTSTSLAGGGRIVDLHHARHTERADIQHRGGDRPDVALATCRDPLHPRRVRTARRDSARARPRRGNPRSCGWSRPPITASATTSPSSICVWATP